MRRYRNQRKILLKYLVAFIVFFVWYELTDVTGLKFENKILPKHLPKLVCALYKGDFANEIQDDHFNAWNKTYGWSFRSGPILAPFITSSYLYPKLGIYSSHDESIVSNHFRMMRESGIDAAILMWEGHNHTDKGFSDAFT